MFVHPHIHTTSQCKLLMCWTHQSLRGIFIQVNWYICKICPVNLYMHSYSCWGPPHKKNNNNLLPIFYIRTFVPTRFWQYVNHSDLYILEKSANLSSYLTTIVKIIWSTVDLLSLKKVQICPHIWPRPCLTNSRGSPPDICRVPGVGPDKRLSMSPMKWKM